MKQEQPPKDKQWSPQANCYVYTYDYAYKWAKEWRANEDTNNN